MLNSVFVLLLVTMPLSSQVLCAELSNVFANNFTQQSGNDIYASINNANILQNQLYNNSTETESLIARGQRILLNTTNTALKDIMNELSVFITSAINGKPQNQSSQSWITTMIFGEAKQQSPTFMEYSGYLVNTITKLLPSIINGQLSEEDVVGVIIYTIFSLTGKYDNNTVQNIASTCAYFVKYGKYIISTLGVPVTGIVSWIQSYIHSNSNIQNSLEQPKYQLVSPSISQNNFTIQPQNAGPYPIPVAQPNGVPQVPMGNYYSEQSNNNKSTMNTEQQNIYRPRPAVLS